MIRMLLIAVLAISLAACGGSATRDKVGNLDRAINDYAYALRWLRKNDAVAYHMNRDRTRPTIDTSALDVIRVTGFNIREKTLDEDMNGAAVVGNLDYYHNEHGMLRTLEYRQDWWYDEESKKWYIESGFPEFK